MPLSVSGAFDATHFEDQTEAIWVRFFTADDVYPAVHGSGTDGNYWFEVSGGNVVVKAGVPAPLDKYAGWTVLDSNDGFVTAVASVTGGNAPLSGEDGDLDLRLQRSYVTLSTTGASATG